MRIQMMRNDHGYKPFFINITFDACKYLLNLRHPVVNLFYTTLKQHSNMNHTCPYDVSNLTIGVININPLIALYLISSTTLLSTRCGREIMMMFGLNTFLYPLEITFSLELLSQIMQHSQKFDCILKWLIKGFFGKFNHN